jgi:EmrB/QacA subfamily drug resistance transporter
MEAGRDRQLVTAAILLGSFLAAFEATAVAAAMPRAVGEMGGVERYSWVFSAYLLTSTTTMPLFGKLADLYGRRKVYHVSVVLFLLGSALSGMAGSLSQLILFRAIQGLGAGGVNPLTITIAGDIYNLKERGRMQGLFSSVWAFSSLSGPLLGGWITDALSWRWIFYLNIPFGIASSLILQRYLREAKTRTKHRLDVLGTVSLTAAVTLLLLGLIEGPDVWGWRDLRTVGLFAGSIAALALFLWQERRAEEPMLPLDLFRNRLIAVASAGNLLVGTFLYSLIAYVPVFAQGVLGGSALAVGMATMPILVGWPIASTLSGRLLMRTGYRMQAIGGGVLLVAGSFLLARVGPATTRTEVMISMMVIGLGLGFTSMPYLLGPQNAVPWERRGVATSSVQFFRSIGGAVGVAALGALFAARLKAVAPEINPNTAFNQDLRAHATPATLARLSGALLYSLSGVYFVLAILAVATFVIALFFPGGNVTSHMHREEDAGFPMGH